MITWILRMLKIRAMRKEEEKALARLAAWNKHVYGEDTKYTN